MINVGLHGGGLMNSTILRHALRLDIAARSENIYAYPEDILEKARMEEFSRPNFEWNINGKMPVSLPGVGNVGSYQPDLHERPSNMQKRRSKAKAAKKAKRKNRK